MSSKSKKKRSQRNARSKASHSTLMPEPNSLFGENVALDPLESIESEIEQTKPVRSMGHSGSSDSLLSDFSFADEPLTPVSRSKTKARRSIAPAKFEIDPEPSPKQAQDSEDKASHHG